MAALLAGSAVAEPCRQALVLGLDVSGSVDAREYRLQLDGLAAALQNPQVVAAIEAVPEVPVRLMVFEWSGPEAQRLLVGWTPLRSGADLAGVASRLRAVQRVQADVSTAIGSALRYARAALTGHEDCWRLTIDISGDGKSNTGPHPRDVSRTQMGRATVNGLVIGQDTGNSGDRRQVELGELSSYFHAYVLAGPDAFVQTAMGFEDYERAMVAKLLRELETRSIALR